MFRVTISPAKTMRVDTDSHAMLGIPPFPDKSLALLERLRAMTRDELQALWKTSDKLTDENIARLAELDVPRTMEEASLPRFSARLTPALFAYDGIQYTSLAPHVLDEGALAWLQERLRILSGFYGCVRPFDGVLPYRLEMGAALPMPAQGEGASTRNLYGFWGGNIARAVCDRQYDPQTASGRAADARSPRGAADGIPPCVVNLASVEYAKVVLPCLPAGVNAVTCVFGELLKRGKPVQRATASKIARGSMLRWMAERNVQDARELEAFDVGYTFAPELSSADAHGNKTLVFMRA